MHDRFTIKIAGPAGAGIKSSGQIIAKAVKRAGYFVFGHMEYPSLIKGGHNVFQIEVSDKPVNSISRDTEVLLPLDSASISLHLDEFDKDGGIIILDSDIKLTPDQEANIKKNNIQVSIVSMGEIALKTGGNILMKNTVSIGAVWKTLGLDITIIQNIIAEIFASKGDDVINKNKECAKAGFDSITQEFTDFRQNFKPTEDIKNSYLITGNESLSLGAIASGVKIYSSYPMTPASSILTNLALWARKSGMLVKQAEDEITSVNMCIGANFAGTRALCGTSGGGFDLMSEAISLAGMSETPLTIVLAQRHGAATGAPTWTGQSDLNIAINAGHSEFPRCILSCSDAKDAFYVISDALNIADKFQLPVIVLTEKTIAESFYCVDEFNESKIVIDRGELIDQDKLNGTELRYEITDSGISPRWFPGQKGTAGSSSINSTFAASSDSHTKKGYSTESENEIKEQIDKQKRKFETLRNSIPEPVKLGDEEADIIFISYGSNKGTLEDAARILRENGKKIQIIHFTYLWPLKTETLNSLKDQQDKVYVVEQNATGQLASLIRKETGLNFKRINKYDGRPFFVEEILDVIPAFAEMTCGANNVPVPSRQ